jgi:protein-tyrosine phosphatase
MSPVSYTPRMVRARLKSTARDLYWGVYGRGLKNPPVPDFPKHVLFICKGNVCRSPFAERYFLDLAKRLGFTECTSMSMGMEVSKNLPPPAEAVIAAAELGVSLDGHRSQRIGREAIARSDMIIVMEALQFVTLRKSYREYRGKLFLLPLFAERDGTSTRGFSLFNIPDPYGKSLDQFRLSFEAIRKCLDRLIQQIVAEPGRDRSTDDEPPSGGGTQ